MFGPKPFGTLSAATTSCAQIATSGTTIKFNPPNGQSTVVRNGVTYIINTKHQCITAMKEYENKSIEELRLEDYILNQRGKQELMSGTLFGTTLTTETRGFNFVGAGSGTGFETSGTSIFGQQQSKGLLGQQNKTAFGTTTPANTGLGFGINTSTGTSLFWQQQKPRGLHRTNPATTQSSQLGVGTGSSFRSMSTIQPTAFGTSQQQSRGLYGTNSTTTQSNMFGVGTCTSFGHTSTLQPTAFGTSQQQSRGLSGTNPATTQSSLFKGTTFGNTSPLHPAAFGTSQSRGLSGTNPVTKQSSLLGVGTGTTFGNTSTLQHTFGTSQQQSRGFSGTNPTTTQSSLLGVGTGTTFGNTSTLQPAIFGTSQQQSRGLSGTNPAITQSSLFKVGTGTTFGNTCPLHPTAFGTSQSGRRFEINPVTTQSSLFGVGTGTSFGNSIHPTALGTSQQQSTGLFAQELSALGTSTTRSALTGFNSLGPSKHFPEPLSKNTFSNFSTVPTSVGAFAKPPGTPGRFGSNTPSPTEGQPGQNTTTNTVTGLFGGGQQTYTFGVCHKTGLPAERGIVGTAGRKRKWLEHDETTGTAAGGFGKRRCRSRDPSHTEGQSGKNTTSGTTTGLFGSQQQIHNFGESQNTGFAKTPGTAGRFGSNTSSPTEGQSGQNTTTNANIGIFGGGQQIDTFGGSQNTGLPAERGIVGTAGRKRKWLEHDETTGTAAGGFNKRRSRSRFPSPTEGQSDLNTTSGTATGLIGGSQNTHFGAGSKTSTASKGGTLFGGQIFRKFIVVPITRFWSNCYKWLNNQIQSNSGQETIVKTGITTNINTKHQCITVIIEDENESIEVNIDID